MPYQRILLIDDDEDDQEIFLTAMAEIACPVTCTALSAADEALRQLLSGRLNPDLIFLDLNMPVINGARFLSEMRRYEALKAIPVILFSTSDHQVARRQIEKPEEVRFLTKPSRFDELVDLLRPLICQTAKI